MTFNRMLTTLIQLIMLGVTGPLVYAMYKDVKENGLFGDIE